MNNEFETYEERKERRREARDIFLQKSKFAIPSGITLLSIFCGFSSVVMSLNAATGGYEYLRYAAIFLILAGIFDGMDGRVARITNTTSEFGVQLDSLADVTSFGMAPAILAYQYGFVTLGSDPSLKFIGWGACFFYIACGALRLARFNVQNEQTDPRFFVGLPIPVAASGIATVVLHWPETLSTKPHAFLFATELFILGILMVSKIRFATLKTSSTEGTRPFLRMFGFIFIMAMLVVFQSTFLFGLFIFTVGAGLLLNIAWMLGWTGVRPPEDHPPSSDTSPQV